MARLTIEQFWRDTQQFQCDELLFFRAIVLAIIDGKPALKRLNRRGGVMVLHNENAKLPTFVHEGAPGGLLRRRG